MELIESLKQVLARAHFFVMPFTVCISLILLFDRVAPKLGIVDKPSVRKLHKGNIPLIGGLAIFFAFALVSIMLTQHQSQLILLALGLTLVLLGSLDDVFDLNAYFRMIIQAVVALLMVFAGGLTINTVGDLTGFGPAVFSPTLAIIFTVVCTLGVINSVNMIDGMDGLAGTILLISFCALGVIAALHGDGRSAKVLLILVGAIVAFLCFNSRVFVDSARIFMGDSGSMFLGFTFCWFLIKLTQGDAPALSAVAAGWIFGLPLADTISVMVKRIRERRSPFDAGRDHIHHMLLDSGFTVNQTLLIMGSAHLLLVLAGVSLVFNAALEPVYFWAFVVLVVLHHYFTPRLLNTYQSVPEQ